MIPEQALRSLRQRGLAIGFRDRNIAVHAPLGTITPEVRAEIEAHKTELLDCLKHIRAASSSPKAMLTAPVSSEQQRLWFQRALRFEGAMNIPIAFRFPHGVPLGLVEQVLTLLVRRHPMLGARFEEANGEPYMVLLDPPPKVPLRTVDLDSVPEAKRASVIEAVLKNDIQRPFDLIHEPPLRGLLLRERGAACILQLNRHHIASDGWSLGLILTDFAAIWETLTRGTAPAGFEPKFGYLEYACRQRAAVNSNTHGQCLAEWRQELRERNLKMFQTTHGSLKPLLLRAGLEADLSSAMRSFCRQNKLTLFCLLTGAFALALGGATSRHDVAFGIDVGTRDSADLECCVGTFVNRVPIGLDLPASGSILEFLSDIKVAVARAGSRAAVPFEDIVAAANPTRGGQYDPLVDVIFGLHAEPRHAMYRHLQLSGIRNLEMVEIADETTVVPLSFYLTDTGSRILAELRYDPNVVSSNRAQEVLSAFRGALAAIVEGQIATADIRRTIIKAVVNRCGNTWRSNPGWRDPSGGWQKHAPRVAEPDLSGSRPETDRAFQGPFVVEARGGDRSPTRWLRANRDFIEQQILESGSVLLRGFGVTSPQLLEACLRVLFGEPMDYRENTSPRKSLQGQIKTSTVHPADQAIELHCEQSYSKRFPLRLLLACENPGDAGGETPLADCRRVLRAISPELRERFRKRRWRYVRHFVPGFGPNWVETYGVQNRDALEQYLASAEIGWTWGPEGTLRTELQREAEAMHPQLRIPTWFNHILFWHHSSLEDAIAAELLRSFGEEQLPHAVFYGDGSPIEPETIAAIREAHWQEAWLHHWQRGDLLIIDNMLTAHGRQRFEGQRKILFGMARPIDRSSLLLSPRAGQRGLS